MVRSAPISTMSPPRTSGLTFGGVLVRSIERFNEQIIGLGWKGLDWGIMTTNLVGNLELLALTDVLGSSDSGFKTAEGLGI